VLFEEIAPPRFSLDNGGDIASAGDDGNQTARGGAQDPERKINAADASKVLQDNGLRDRITVS